MRLRLAVPLIAAIALAGAGVNHPAAAQGKQTPTPSPSSAPSSAPAAAVASDAIDIELNALEPLKEMCRVSFVIRNTADEPLSSIKLDLAVFNPEGVVQRRLVAELGPIRASKTMVKAFELDRPCAQIGSLLVNDVTECAPADPSACLDRLKLASRAGGVRFFK